MGIEDLLKWVLHLDDRLLELVQSYGAWTYLILFAIVFCETGLVVTPFLPGDSLLFAAGALAGGGALRAQILIPLLMAAALAGDNVNYWIGRKVGPAVFNREDSRWLRRKHLERTHAFFEKYGGKTIIIARFVPIVRTFTPFVAGVGSMTYARFLRFSIFGAAIWVCSLVLAGYWFGRLEFVKRNFELVILAIVVISLVPMAVELIRARYARTSTGDRDESVGRP
jgi:membrane-associated protein